jgi:hypothetical protein
MSTLHHLLRRCTGAIALVLACAVLVGSLCPRGWFVCVHEHDLVLVGGAHVQEQGDCPDADCCPADDDTGCLDLALSLVLDDQTTALPVWGVLPPGVVFATLPDLKAAAQSVWLPLDANLGEPPPSRFVSHICLVV